MDVSSSPLSILYIITKGSWGGAQRYVYELALEAKARGNTVCVASGSQGELIQKLNDAGIPVVRVPGLARDIRLGADLRALLGLMSLIRSLHPDVVHTNSSKAGFIAALAARLSGVQRIIFTAHGWAWNELRPKWQKLFFKTLHFLTVFLSHTTIAVSEAVRKDAAWMPLVQKKFEVVRHGVAPLTRVARDEARLRLTEAAGVSLPSSALWIGSLAELHPTKGLDVLIRAFATVAAKQREAILVCVGGGEDAGRLKALSHMLHVEERVFFTGHVQEAARLLGAFDVFVLPSHSEALGYVLLEAGQASLPVVASNVGGIPEIIVDQETGLLVPSADPEALAQAMSELVEDASKRNRLGNTLHTRVQEMFGLKRMMDATFALYPNPRTQP
jgi:glycosyltransferase involved in cell wall biosynthesis